MPTPRPTTIDSRAALYRDACRIIDESYSTDVLIDDVALRLITSRRQLQRAFADVGGTTFRDHLTSVRLQRAADLLLRARWMPIRDVASAVGYRQPAQFAKAFHRYQGVTPSAYRASLEPLPDIRDRLGAASAIAA